MRTREQLRQYQRAAIRFIKETKRCLLFIDPGLGKTASTLTAMCDLMDNLDCGRVLVIAPPNVARNTWHAEMAAWAHLKNRSYAIIDGTPKKRRELLKRNVCFHIISMELLPWLLQEFGGDVPRFTTVLGGEIEQTPQGFFLGGKPLKRGDTVKSPDGNLYRVGNGKIIINQMYQRHGWDPFE